MVLIIDSRHKSQNPPQRISTISVLCNGLGFEAQVVPSVARAQPLLAPHMHLILLHCGDDQTDAAQALNQWQERCILAYYGGWNPSQAVYGYFATNPSRSHGLIPETVELSLQPGSDAAQKLENCLQLILRQGRQPPEAVQEVYGDPDLEEILDKLYRELTPGADLKRLRDARDADLEEHYGKRRGW